MQEQMKQTIGYGRNSQRKPFLGRAHSALEQHESPPMTAKSSFVRAGRQDGLSENLSIRSGTPNISPDQRFHAPSQLSPSVNSSKRKYRMSESPTKSVSEHSKTTKVVGGHALAIRDFSMARGKLGKHAKLNDHSIAKKEFGKDDNDGRDSMQWHIRQKDWYNAERRFIFAAPTEKQRDKWIDLI